MNKQNGMMKRIVKLAMLLMLGSSLSACAGFLGFGGDSWKEEVLLHDGSKIIARRPNVAGGMNSGRNRRSNHRSNSNSSCPLRARRIIG